jgi:hypothetical protein
VKEITQDEMLKAELAVRKAQAKLNTMLVAWKRLKNARAAAEAEKVANMIRRVSAINKTPR